jgi:caffeoyl-CoA O-methyltransferase
LRESGELTADFTILSQGYPFTPELQEKNKKLPHMGIDESNGKALIEFNKYVSEDTRCQVVVLPIRDGISWIMVN